MAKFDLSQYETVESRIKRFVELYPDGRITTDWANEFAEFPEKARWVVKAKVFLSAGDQANGLVKATGYASEVDGSGGANNIDALANCETSAIGRALANMGMSGNKRASLEEMQKAERLSRNWLEEADKLSDVNALRLLWAEANAAKVDAAILDTIKEKASNVADTSSSSGRGQGSVRSSSSEQTRK